MPKIHMPILHLGVKKVYNSLMKYRTRHSKKTIPQKRIEDTPVMKRKRMSPVRFFIWA